MASLKDATKLMDQLESLVGDLRSELEDGGVDFEKLVTIADEISEHADGLAETFSSINDTLMQRLDQLKGGGGSNGSSNGRSQRSQRKKAAASSES
jgi:hypothetical protein